MKLSERVRDEAMMWPTPFVMQERVIQWADQIAALENRIEELERNQDKTETK